MKPYLLIGKSGSQVIPNGKRYFISKAIVGQSAIILDAESDGGFTTSPLKEIIVLGNELTLVTQNTQYYFEEAAE